MWVWILDAFGHLFDALLALWRVDREMREGRWDEDDSEDSRAVKRRARRRLPRRWRTR